MKPEIRIDLRNSRSGDLRVEEALKDARMLVEKRMQEAVEAEKLKIKIVSGECIHA